MPIEPRSRREIAPGRSSHPSSPTAPTARAARGRWARALAIGLILVAGTGLCGCSESGRRTPGSALPSSAPTAPTGVLALTIVDAGTDDPTPARVALLGADGAHHVATDALRVGGDCDMSDAGAGYRDLASTLAGFTDRLENPYSGATEFYSTGRSSVPLPAGAATVIVSKGPEYRVATVTVEIEPGETRAQTISLERWIDMPARGWYSADDHLHIPRPSPELDPAIARMMQAEDVHVANLLQMGKVRNFAIAPQYAHGPAGVHQVGRTILAAGQENPRTHFLGHTITLGASAARHDLDHYLVYRRLWEITAAEGALNGFAHAYAPNGSMIATHDGMAVVAPHDLLHFVEVLQFNRSGYETWYDLLSLGFRVTPTAGTDYPCGDQTIPGHERFYTRVEGPLDYSRWLEGVRRGRTFVTTGPMVELEVGGAEIGDELRLPGPGRVAIRGRALFDPSRDDLAFLELVQNGAVVGRYSRLGGASEIAFETERFVDEASWFALRGYGTRLENTFTTPGHFNSFAPTSNVHTAPIHVILEGHPGLEASPVARRVARTWLARLEDLERMLAADDLEDLAARLAAPTYDAVPRQTLLADREALLAEIRHAKAQFEARVAGRIGSPERVTPRERARPPSPSPSPTGDR